METFRVQVTDSQLADLHARLRTARWPDRETVSDWSQGIPLGYMRELVDYWAEPL